MKRRDPIIVTSAAPPDLDAAAGAMLPMFLAFMAGRLKRAPEGEKKKAAPVAVEERGSP